MRAQSPTVLVGATVMVAVLAGCSQLSLRPADSSTTGTPALERYYTQSLDWGSCASIASTNRITDYDPAMECTRVTVPIDYDNPAAGDLDLAVARTAALGTSRGSLLTNPGGPGGSGVEFLAGQSTTLDSIELAQDFDLVSWDPRGVGASNPAVRCVSDEQRDENRRSNLGSDNTPSGIAAQEEFNRNYAQSCADAMGETVLANLGTVDTVRDLDVLRAVLGDNQLTYLGFSYGTLIGSQYAQTFPGNVRAMVLDGAIDPALDLGTSLVNQGAGFQRVFDDFARDCATLPDCPLGSDPGQATRVYQELVRPLIDSPVPGSRGRELSYSDANTGTLQAMYSPSLWSVLRDGLTELTRGTGATLQRLADIYLNRDDSGAYSSMSDANMAINCMDGPTVTDPAELGRIDTAYRAAAPFRDDGTGTGLAARDVCAFWPVPPSLIPAAASAPGAPQLVVVSTTNDPATPYQAGVDLAQQLGASLITYEGSQHTVVWAGDQCVDDAATAYLRDRTLPPADLTCVP